MRIISKNHILKWEFAKKTPDRQIPESNSGKIRLAWYSEKNNSWKKNFQIKISWNTNHWKTNLVQSHKRERQTSKRQTHERQTPERQTPERQTPERQTPERQTLERQTHKRQTP